jgi:two-component system, chemotaxis family, response regulator Rcp1
MERLFDLLVVDDEPAQLRLMQIVIKELGLRHRFHCATSAAVALDFLNRRAPFQDAPRPHLILLDVNMPGMNGCEVLQCIKQDPRFRSIPVIMLSNSQALNDIATCYGAHANAYICKPKDLAENLTVMRELSRFWFQTASLTG